MEKGVDVATFVSVDFCDLPVNGNHLEIVGGSDGSASGRAGVSDGNRGRFEVDIPNGCRMSELVASSAGTAGVDAVVDDSEADLAGGAMRI